MRRDLLDRENDKHPRGGSFGREPYGKKPVPFDLDPIEFGWDKDRSGPTNPDGVLLVAALASVACGVLMAIGVLTVCRWFAKWIAG